MASAQLQKQTNGTCPHGQEENKITHKISGMTAWGGRVFGHKQQEHQAVSKHCTTCQCPPPKKDTKPASTDAYTETKKKEEHAGTINKNAKHNTSTEVKKKEKHHITITEAASGGMKKETKEYHAKSNTANPSNTMIKKEHKGQPANHCFSSMADHWKEKIMTKKKPKEIKSKDSSSSDSDSDNEEKTCDKKKKEKKHYKEIKATSK